MQLKRYQTEALDRLRDFFRFCRTMDPAAAYARATDDAEARNRLGMARGYTPLENDKLRMTNDELPSIPLVSLKVPTGGGKTILGAHAIRVAAEWAETDAPLALWFAPTDTIRAQTAEALKKAGHPYREALEESFGTGRIRVFDLSETDQIRPADLAGGACIVVATMQAFVKRDTDKYRVYRDREALEPLFVGVECGAPGGRALPEMGGASRPGEPVGADRRAARNVLDMRDDDPSKPKCSFANLCALRHPVIVADEAHHMTSELSRRTLARLAPCAVIGLSATPERENNTLWAARASELFAEEMIKLPVELTEFPSERCDWTKPVLAALAKRDELERLALEEWDGGRGAPWLRPMALFQAQSDVKGAVGRVTAAELRRFLVEEAGRDPAEIAVVTGEQKELDGVDVRDPRCPVRLVVTVEALKEGWDCPSAAVLCSVANVRSETATVQLLGRVMRQPGAKRRRTPALNKAFAFVVSDGFGAAASALAEGLRARGFDEAEAARAIEPVQAALPGADGLFARADAVHLEPEVFEVVAAALPAGFSVEQTTDGGGTLVLAPGIAEADAEAVATALETCGGEAGRAAAMEWRAKGAVLRRRAAEEERAPCRTRRFVLPRLAARLADEPDLFVHSAEEAWQELGRGIEAHLPPMLAPGEFRMEHMGEGFTLYLDGERMRFAETARGGAAQAEFGAEGFGTRVDAAGLVNALDALTPDPAIGRAEKRGWISRIVAGLVAGGATPDALFGHRHALADVLRRRLGDALVEARKEAYQAAFRLGGAGGAAPELRWDDGFVLDETLYEGQWAGIPLYDGEWVFEKHYLGRYHVPAFDGQKAHGEGEEFECAKEINRHPAVENWLRNVDSNADSFKLPLSNGHWFYPDFVGELKDNRFFAVEYKGEQLRHNPDTFEKTAVGQLWAKLSGGRCVYATVFARDDAGRDVRAQLDALFAPVDDGEPGSSDAACNA